MTYLLASLLLDGLTIVISPLISMMIDQLKHLPSCISAACISSALHRGQLSEILSLVRRNQITILFITP